MFAPAKTFDLLATTQNDAASAVLALGLECGEPEIRERSVRAILERPSETGHREFVKRWHLLPPNLQALAVDAGYRLENALREALLERDLQHFENGCQAALLTRCYDLMPLLVAAIEEGGSRRAELGLRTLRIMAEELHVACHAPPDSRWRRSPDYVRQGVLPSVERAAQWPPPQRRRELIETFLLLCTRETSALKAILQSPDDRCYGAFAKELQQSRHPGVLRLLVNFLDDPHAPLVAMNAIRRRRDAEFQQALFAKVNLPLSHAAKDQLRRWDTLAIVNECLLRIPTLSAPEQTTVVRLLTHLGLPAPALLSCLGQMFDSGEPAACRAVLDAVAEIPGPEADLIISAAAQHAHPEVQAHALPLVRTRRLPGGMGLLMERIESPQQIIREAAQRALSEFSCERLLAVFDTLSPDSRRNTAELVRKVDPHMLDRLIAELRTPVRSRWLRALEIIDLMEFEHLLESTFVQLLGHSDELLRVAVIDRLATLNTPAARVALREALVDGSLIVQQAAEDALQRMAHRSTADAWLPDPNASRAAPLAAEWELPTPPSSSTLL